MNSQVQNVSARDKRLLLLHVLGIDGCTYIAESPVLKDDEQQTYAQLLLRRAKGEPVAKIIGKKAFWNDEFFTNTHTLDPRPDTEHIITAVLARYRDLSAPLSIIDFGTGSGCILLSLLQEYPNANGHGVDASSEALEIAQRNANALNATDRVNWYHLRWTSMTKSLYDVAVSNPPYIPSSDMACLDVDVRDYDPHIALDGGIDGLNAYRELFTIMNEFVRPGGYFICEIGEGQSADVTNIGLRHDWTLECTINDLAGITRVMVWTH